MVLGLLVCLPFAQDASDFNRAQSEYASAIPRLEERFRMVRGSGVLTREQAVGEPGEKILRNRLVFAQNRDSWKVTSHQLNEQRDRGPFQIARVMTNKRAFVLHWEQEFGPPLLKGVAQTTAELHETNIGETWESFVGESLAAPYSIWGLPILKIMADPSFRLERVSELNRDSKRFLKLEFQFDFVGNQSPQKAIRSVALLVCPDDAWAIHDYEYNQRFPELANNPGRNYWGHVEYGPKQDGFPTLRHVTVVEGKKTELGARQFRRLFDFDEFKFETVPEKEFSLSFFGLPELDRPAVKPGSHIGYWFIGIAVALLLFALLLKRYGVRLA